MVKNKRGWVRIIEVFISITLVAMIVLILVDENIPRDDLSDKVSSMEISILKEIRINESLRGEILNANIPTNWSDFESGGLTGVKGKIEDSKFSVLECEAKICSLEDQCSQDSNITKDVYARSGVFSANIDIYSPRQMSLFCWEK